ncbi:hypothetical protein AVEN_221253-1 [Araneus ventricosus]|uniref:Uncharacterized protein n=1 Tax=Araneus ventricosus TaxID=182803 RepID=A0A4Y2LT67_ARAVE|nr:hypothetical protein AVEN_221253-1 [Araneus ventricosus]
MNACTQTDHFGLQKRALSETSGSSTLKWQNVAADTNPFINMVDNPFANRDGSFANVFSSEYLNEPHNPFLSANENQVLFNTGESWIQLTSSNPFFKEYLNNPVEIDSAYILNLPENPLDNLPQGVTDYDIYCQEWVKEHRKFHLKNVRSFSIY